MTRPRSVSASAYWPRAPRYWPVLWNNITASAVSIRDFCKLNCPRDDILWQAKHSGRNENGTDQRGQSTAVEHGQGSQRQRTASVYGTYRSSLGERRSATC